LSVAKLAAWLKDHPGAPVPLEAFLSASLGVPVRIDGECAVWNAQRVLKSGFKVIESELPQWAQVFHARARADLDALAVLESCARPKPWGVVAVPVSRQLLLPVHMPRHFARRGG
jgi:hypothetical protein